MKTMKEVINRIAICTILFLGTFTLALANMDIPSIKISPYGISKLSLVMDGMSMATEATISLEDERGYVLLSEKVKKTSSFGKIFNLQNLPEGKYTLNINTQTRKTIQPIQLIEGNIIIDESKRKVVFHPVIRQNGNHLDISWLANRISSVKVTIQHNSGATVFEDKIQNVIKAEKRYNIAQLGEGAYTVIVKTPYDNYTKEIIVQ